MQAVTKGFLLPPRSTSDILSSAFKAGVSLIFNQTSRESLKKLMDKGVINERVLLRAEFGLSRMLSLYSDLESPVMKKYGFNVEEFMEGVTPALEQFHNVQRNLTNSLHSIEAETSDTTVSSSTEKNEESNDADDKETTMSQVAEEHLAALTALTGLPGSNEEMVRLLKSDWKKQAVEKPDSLAGQLYGMTTPEFFDLMQIGNKTSYLVEKNKKMYQDGSGEVHNVCLLSARSMIMDDSEDKEDAFDAPESELNVAEGLSSNTDEDESSSSKEEDRLPVAAQVEVLYTIDEVFTALKDNESSSKDDSEGKEIRQTTVAVGVFEGWLNGGPNGQELRWRLSMYRPAWEFNLLD